MKPNFEDLSCDMIFGQPPPALEEDEAFAQPCFATQCAIAAARQEAEACPKVGPSAANLAMGRQGCMCQGLSRGCGGCDGRP